MNSSLLALTAGLAGVMTVLSRQAIAAPQEAIVDVQTVHDLAERVINQHGFNVSPCMITAMAVVESGDVNNPDAGVNRFASRYEAHLGDASTGIMQTLLGTAQWLARDMGYDRFGIPDAADLYDVNTSIYIGAAYADWLSTYAGQERKESWIVQSYNAGPGNKQSWHLNKYDRAKLNLKKMGVC